MGVSQSQFLTGLSTFGNSFPQNGSKTVPKSQNRPLGYPYEGPFVENPYLTCGGLNPQRVKNDFYQDKVIQPRDWPAHG